MSKLVLVPTIRDFNRAEIEQQVEHKRQRRMQAALVYHEGKTAKLQHQSDEIAKRFRRAIDMLQKDINSFDAAYDRLQKRLNAIGEYTEGYKLVQDLIEAEEV